MKGKIGCPSRIVTPVPHLRELAKKETKYLSEKAKLRLKIFDYYYQISSQYSLSGKPNAKLTCRHFGIHRSYFYRWKARYDKTRLSSLENKPTIPAKQRKPDYSCKLVNRVKDIRKADPTYSGAKIRAILLREMRAESVPSAPTLNRLIFREKLWFRHDIKRRQKHSKAAIKAHQRKRKPYNLNAKAPKQIIEFDMKHIYLLGMKQYAFCGIDTFTREVVVHIACSPSSLNARTALNKIIDRFGNNIKIVNDNGSENMSKAEEYLASMNIPQYWTRPYTPKDKPFVERFIGTLQKECLDYYYTPLNVAELSVVVQTWVNKYHNYRPHAALGFLTPAQFHANINLSIPPPASVI
ncbi:MAG: hypothetical protein Pg6A_00190 [Termitinemataceae bacterium]|nr:MAG: hypothetical protein Pg6A_00190 [Termitinemataceae bacterium]